MLGLEQLKRQPIFFEGNVIEALDGNIDAFIAVGKTQALEQGKTSLIVISGCRTGGGKSLLLRSHTSPLSTPYFLCNDCVHLINSFQR